MKLTEEQFVALWVVIICVWLIIVAYVWIDTQ